MKRLTMLLLTLTLLFTFALAEETPESAEWNGSYICQENNSYVLTFKDGYCRIGFGSNFFTAGYTVEENNAVHVQDKGQFWYFDFTAVMAEDGILVTGDIILKNARGGRDSRSLTGLENAVFTAKAPFDLSQLAGTHWMRREVIKKDEKLPFDSSEITFGDGKGSIGDWFYGAASFTYTVENETVTLDFGQDGLQATAVYQDDLLILDFGYAVISYTLM